MIRRMMTQTLRLIAMVMIPYVAVTMVVFLCQRLLLFLPTHHDVPTLLQPWLFENRTLGYCREVPGARTVWLMTHGNGGQAADRDYVLGRMSDQESLYVLEYPGYGARDGKSCRDSFNQAAAEAYRILKSQYPDTPVCVLGESIGSGPACELAWEQTPPDKIVLVVPFDSLVSVASNRFFFLPVRLLLLDDWDNVDALKDYTGPVEIFAATGDEIIPIEHAQALAEQIPHAQFTAISGGHNDWSASDDVWINR